MIKQELTYWVTLALIPKIWTKRKNEIYVNCFKHNPQISIVDLFENSSTWDIVGLNDLEKALFQEAKSKLANNAFLVEDMTNQGYDIFPITHPNYPKILKDNLKFNAPTVIYTKGNPELLQAPSLAIVGSRKADATSLSFTDNIAKKATLNNKVIVSGFAKGVDRQALDSTLEANGKSIVVLPQGIMTFTSGFKQYFKHIAQGRVLVMSTFAPKAPWSVELAMARNPIIYGMASEIFVAQSDDKGGTWSGVIDGLRKNRPIYVRYPDGSENNANILLIQKGASAVDIFGNIITLDLDEQKDCGLKEIEKTDSDILALINSVDMISVKDIISGLRLEWKEEKVRRYLDNLQNIEKVKIKNRVYYRIKGRQSGLFD
jgi:DNA protecting protein DprA